MKTYFLSLRKVRFLLIVLAVFMLAATSYAGGKGAYCCDPDPAMDQYYDVVREDAPGLPGWTVYRPANLIGARCRLPIVIWSNGACTITNDSYVYFLMQVAAHGFVIVAFGEPDEHSSPNGQAVEDRMSTAIDWVTSKPRHGGPWYFYKLDASKIATMGHSCGGIDAIWTGEHDSRVKTTVSLNSGCFPDDSTGGMSGPLAVCRPYLEDLSGPAMFIAGGPTDVAYNNSIGSYDRVPEEIGAVFASHATAGHGGFYGTVSRTIQLQLVEAVVNWLDGTLNDNMEALSFLVGPDPGLGDLADWTVESKGF
ncbi:MAG: hypothetical protein JW932_06785 [Deltaproteobacteria bacterium]|nr:hypothetical protein [Deltaproteobacteria bacterium]